MRSTTALPLEQQAAQATAALMEAVELVVEATRAGAFAAAPSVVQPALAISLLRSADQAKAAATMATGVVHASGWLPDGQVSLGRWLERAAGMTSRDANGLVAHARALEEDYAETADAWLSGEISGAAVRAIRHGVDKILRTVPSKERPQKRADIEGGLIEKATRMPVDELAHRIAGMRVRVDPDGARQAEIDAYDDQKVTFTPVGAGVVLKGWLSNETYAQMRTAIEQVVDGWHRSGALPEPDRVDDDEPRPQHKKRARQGFLFALALAQICHDATESGSLGTHHGLVPRITLTASLDLLTQGFGGEMLLPGHDTPALATPDALRRFLCDAEVTLLIEAGCRTGDPLDLLFREASESVLWVGRNVRTVTPRQRRALEHRDRHCAFPGCRVTVRRCRAHHVVHWEKGGLTDLDNLVLVCERHHRSVHDEGWSVVPAGADPRDHGYWQFVPPPTRRQP